ncbi:hypothetical protein ACFXJ8_38675 [Nonomuraea sp. NPDC059194]|uniref:hypothetical protein n=1 Tax=Nonomuraea sp. NPDC059194 TaxID=3346764 RepID=UPI0036A9B243
MSRRTGAVLAAAALLAAASPAVTLPSVAEASALVAADRHVDCSATDPGDGTLGSPWNSLNQVNQHTFGPGDRLLFRRGVTCRGTLKPTGSGTVDAPFLISDYGDGTGRAVLDGDGAYTVIHLFNSQHVTIEGLEVTNAVNPGTNRRGITVQLEDYGVGSGYRIQDVYLHDVVGDDAKGPSGSQGIAFQVTGSGVPTRFHDVQILDNRLHYINRQGIVIALSTWNCRPEIGCTTPANWLPSTGVVVRGNHLSSLGGDGIVLNTTDGAIAEHNTIEGFNERSAGWNAGLWTYNSNGFLGQFNDVSGGFGTKDSMAYDIDGGNLGATFQYNLSHDNDGGFFLFCPVNGPVRDAVVRYNVSQNDHHRGIENCNTGSVESAQVYNNTIYIGDGISQVVVNENTVATRNVTMSNNIIYKGGTGTASFKFAAGTGYRFDRNTISAWIANPPVNPGGTTANPLMCNPGRATTLATARGYRLQPTSPAINAGAAIAGNGGRDFFGASITNPPNIGASEVVGC